MAGQTSQAVDQVRQPVVATTDESQRRVAQPLTLERLAAEVRSLEGDLGQRPWHELQARRDTLLDRYEKLAPKERQSAKANAVFYRLTRLQVRHLLKDPEARQQLERDLSTLPWKQAGQLFNEVWRSVQAFSPAVVQIEPDGERPAFLAFVERLQQIQAQRYEAFYVEQTGLAPQGFANLQNGLQPSDRPHKAGVPKDFGQIERTIDTLVERIKDTAADGKHRNANLGLHELRVLTKILQSEGVVGLLQSMPNDAARNSFLARLDLYGEVENATRPNDLSKGSFYEERGWLVKENNLAALSEPYRRAFAEYDEALREVMRQAGCVPTYSPPCE